MILPRIDIEVPRAAPDDDTWGSDGYALFVQGLAAGPAFIQRIFVRDVHDAANSALGIAAGHTRRLTSAILVLQSD